MKTIEIFLSKTTKSIELAFGIEMEKLYIYNFDFRENRLETFKEPRQRRTSPRGVAKILLPDFVRQLPIQCGYHRVEHLFFDRRWFVISNLIRSFNCDWDKMAIKKVWYLVDLAGRYRAIDDGPVGRSAESV